MLQVRAQDPDKQAVGNACPWLAIELHLADAAFDDADRDAAVADRLLRQVRLRQEVAASAVVGPNFGRVFVQYFEVEFFADELLDDRWQLRLGIERVAGEAELVYLHLELRRCG